MGLAALSDYQYLLAEKMSQVYKPETLQTLYGEAEGHRRWRASVNEVIAVLGKGSGKNYTSTISVAYVVHKLLCLKNPARYYNKPRGDKIDILNIAINADQAANNFFNPLVQRIRNSPWFEDKLADEPTKGHIEFRENIQCHSGHSQREGWEGYNLIMAILDEISGFAVENTTGHQQAKTAQAIYDMYRASVQSRFAKYGKTILLSFPRFRGDFITTRYDKVVAEKRVIEKSHTFKLREELSAGYPGNEFTVHWVEDEIISYKQDKVFALKLPTWVINPTVHLEDLKNDFFNNPIDALSRFACMPPESVDAFFKQREPVEAAFPRRLGPFLPETWVIRRDFKPKPETKYFVHVDLAAKHDRAAVAMAHVEKWVDSKYSSSYGPAPYVVVDALRYWTPTSDTNIDFTEIKDFIWELRARGFNIDLVTFDQWHSIDVRRELEESGMRTDLLSVQLDQYSDLSLVVHEKRLEGYHDDILLDELLGLRIIKGNKVDHPRKGSNDLADAVCGAVFNALQHAEYEGSSVVEVHTLQDTRMHAKVEAEEPRRAVAPPPPELREFFESLKVL